MFDDDVLGADDDDDGPPLVVVAGVGLGLASFERAGVGARALWAVLSRLTGRDPLGVRVVARGGSPLVRTELSAVDAEVVCEVLGRFVDACDAEFGVYPALVSDAQSVRRRGAEVIDAGRADPAWHAVAAGVDGAEYVAAYQRAFPVAVRLATVLHRVLLTGQVRVMPLCALEGGEAQAAVRFELEPVETERIVGDLAALWVSGFARSVC